MGLENRPSSKSLWVLLSPHSGSVSLPDKVGILRQNIEAFHEMSVLDVVLMGNSRLWEALQERDAALRRRDERCCRDATR